MVGIAVWKQYARGTAQTIFGLPAEYVQLMVEKSTVLAANE